LLEKNTDIKVIDLNWRKLISDFSSIEVFSSTETEAELNDFLNYYERRYGMSNQKEILVQDLSEPDQIEKYKYGLYRRDKVKGSPLYFAPYFTNKTDDPGLGSISKILGIITTQNIEWQNVKPTCERFLENASYKKDEKKRHLERWEKAVNSKDETLKKDIEATYYFLDDMTPIQPRLKKGGKLLSQIPKNYTITFAELLIEYNYRDMILNTKDKSCNCGLFVSLKTETIPNKGKFKLEFLNNFPIIYVSNNIDPLNNH
jgi:hypothetical protein